MRLRLPGCHAVVYSACLVVLAARPALGQYTDPPSTAPNFWLSVGAGSGSAGNSSGLMAAVVSAWISKGTFVGGIRNAVVQPWEHGDESSDVAALVGLRTPPSFAALVGTVGYSRASTRCAFLPCPATYSPTASGAMAFSLQARLSASIFGLGLEVFGARGSGMNRFTAAALTLQMGSFAH
jgi:hypothetical protein